MHVSCSSIFQLLYPFKISDRDCHGMLWFQHLGLELNVEKEGLGICVTYGTVFIKRYLQTVPRM